MSARSLTIAPTRQKTDSCSCGCTPHEKICCQLDCLERPRFFCGQLLTDQDLTALIHWTQEKLRLARFKHGWGVVCGSEVRRHSDNASRIVVSTGYAVTCCGDDIVICTETEHDLSDACPPRDPTCADLGNPTEATAGEMLYFGGQSFASVDVCAVDLILRYVETEAIPQTALGRSACREVAQCEFSRTREGFVLVTQAANGSSPPAEVAERWRQQYQAWVEEQLRIQGRAVAAQGENGMQAALLHLMQHFHTAPLPGDCYQCLADAGVPLARIWLLRPTSRREPARVLAIDSYPPYRRPFMAERWPAPPGQTNLARFLWQRYSNNNNEVDGALADLGLHVEGKRSLDASAAQETLRTARLFWAYDRPLVVLTTNMGALGERVVGFGDWGNQKQRDQPPTTTQTDEGANQERTQSPVSTAPSPPVRDDLTRITGIGRRSAEELYRRGYLRFADVAVMEPNELRNMLTRPVSEDVLASIIRQAGELARINESTDRG